MGIKPHVVRLGIVLALLPVWQNAHAIDLFLTDFDDTLVETRVAAGGTFGTEYKLKLVNPNLLLPDMSNMPPVIWISPQLEETWRHYFAINADSATRLDVEFTLPNGQRIIPGLYYQDKNDVFERYLDHANNPGHLKNEFELAAEKAAQAQGKVKTPKAGFAGPSFALFQARLSHPELAKHTGILSARGHGAQAWNQLFETWLQRGYIKALPSMYYALSNPQFGIYEEKKERVIVELARQLERVEKDRRELTSRDGTGTESLHTIVYADDNQKHLWETYKEIQRITQIGELNHVKVIFINAGAETEINQTDRMGVRRDLPALRAFVIQRNGLVREAYPAELIAEIPANERTPEIKAFLSQKNAFMPQARCAQVFGTGELQ